MTGPRVIKLTRDQPLVLPAPRSAPYRAWIVPGRPGTGLEIDERVATYADLPTLGPDDRSTYLVTGDGLLYTWDGTSWPAQGDGIEVQGETGPQGRGIAGVSVSGNNLVFAMTDATTETATVPAIVAANDAAAAASAAAGASAGYRDEAAGHAGDASDSADAAADSAAAAAASADEAADIVGAGVPNATPTVKGGIMLAGDLGGTYDAPTVPGLAAKANDAAVVHRTGDETIAGTKRFTGDGAGNTYVDVDAPAGKYAILRFRAGGSGRWDFSRNDGTESGSNAGSSFSLSRRNDAGDWIDDPLTISRQTGIVSAPLGVRTRTKDGAPTDGDWAAAPADGMIVVDTTNNRIAYRSGGAWRSAASIAEVTTALAGKADLSGGKLLTSQLPDMAIVDYLGSVNTQAAMLALTGQKGDWCIRSDLGTVWIIVGADPTQLSAWQQVAYPAAPVSSVAGKTGAVTLAAGDIASGTFAIGRIPTGTTSTTVTIGNDARLSDTRTPTDGTVSTAKIVDSAVTTAKLGSEAVTYAKMAVNSVGGYNIMDGAVGTTELADSAVTDAKVSASAGIAPTKLGTGRVTGQANGAATSTVIERMTAAQYSAATKDANTLYFVAG